MPAALRHTLTVARRELGELFGSPTFYIVAALFHLILGAFFVQLLVDLMEHFADPYKRSAYEGELNVSQFVLTNMFDIANSLMLFIVPILTMRLIAEEKRRGMFELLVSTPASDWSLLAGKALGAYAAVALLALSVLVYPQMAARLAAIEWGLVASATLGLLLLGAAYVAFGLFASTLTDNAMIAAVISLVGNLAFSFLAYLGPSDSSWLSGAMRNVSFAPRSRELFEGMVRGEDVLYFAVFAGFFVFAAARVLEARRWRV